MVLSAFPFGVLELVLLEMPTILCLDILLLFLHRFLVVTEPDSFVAKNFVFCNRSARHVENQGNSFEHHAMANVMLVHEHPHFDYLLVTALIRLSPSQDTSLHVFSSLFLASSFLSDSL